MIGGPSFETIDPGYPIRKPPYGAPNWSAGFRTIDGVRVYRGPVALHRAAWGPATHLGYGPPYHRIGDGWRFGIACAHGEGLTTVGALKVSSWKQSVMWEIRGIELECLVNAWPGGVRRRVGV